MAKWAAKLHFAWDCSIHKICLAINVILLLQDEVHVLLSLIPTNCLGTVIVLSLSCKQCGAVFAMLPLGFSQHSLRLPPQRADHCSALVARYPTQGVVYSHAHTRPLTRKRVW